MRYFTISALFSVLLLTACSEEQILDESPLPSSITLSLQMPSEPEPSIQTRVGLQAIEHSKNLQARWSETDRVQAVLQQGKKVYDLGYSRVTNISDDKTSASVNLFINNNKISFASPFTLYLFTGNDNRASADSLDNGAWAAYCNFDIQRGILGYFHAPLFCQLEVKNPQNLPKANFRHFGTYELLHVYNATNLPISFTHQGFDIENPWYQASKTVWFYDGYDLSPHGEWDGDSESQDMIILPGKENIIYSWYIPSGFPISNATLFAKVNGKTVKSINTFSSSVLPKCGHAYHLYASWDGEQLQFDQSAPVRLSLSSYELKVQKGYGGTIQILSGSGNYSVSCNKEKVAQAKLSKRVDGSMHVYITALSVDKAVVTVKDLTTRSTATINVTVTEEATPYAEGSYVDLGLPSGTLWATCNVGATKPEESGWYLSWGELTEKDYYSIGNYYMFKAGNTTDLSKNEDVATMVLGDDWCMPTYDQLVELLSCSWSWEKEEGVQGARVTGPSGQSIFLPASTFKDSSGSPALGTYGSYWGRTHGNTTSGIPCGAELVFGTSNWHTGWSSSDFYFEMGRTGWCFCGRSVRPVYIGK